MVTPYYTLHSIVLTYSIYKLSSFSQFELVLVNLNWLQQLNHSLDWVELIWIGFLPISPVFWILPY